MGDPLTSPPLPSPLHPLGHKLSKGSWLQCSHRRYSTEKTEQNGLEFQMFRRDRCTLPREHLLQLGGVVDVCSSVSVCHFIHPSKSRRRAASQSRTLVFTGRHADVLTAPTKGNSTKACQLFWSLSRNTQATGH